MRGIVLLAALAAPCAAQQPVAPRRPPVIVVAFDGFARRLLDEDSVPTFHMLARTGVLGDAMIPSYPTVTFPNFYTLATGLYPDHTGIVNNTFYDAPSGVTFSMSSPAAKEGKWWGGEPIWITAGKQGLKTASMFWVGSEAPVQGQHPTYWMDFDSRIQFESRVVQVLSWLAMPDSMRPSLIMCYLEEPDHTEHEYGPESPQAARMVMRADSVLAMLVDGLRARGQLDSANLVIVADHGMTAVSADRLVYLDDYVDSASVRVTSTGPLLLIESKTGDNAALLAKLRTAPHLTVWPKDSVPARLHYGTNPRVAAIVGALDDGWLIVWRHARAAKLGGSHGYDNADPKMEALFIAHGPAFVSGSRVGRFPNVDVYSLLAELLGIVPARTDGELAPFLPVLKR